VSANLLGAASGNAFGPAISGDGSRVAFSSSAGDLHPLDANGDADVFVRNLGSGATSLVSVNAAGANSGNGASHSPTLSASGNVAIFATAATDLFSGDFNGFEDLLVRDLAAQSTALLSRADARLPSVSAGGSSFPRASVSADGRYVAFVSAATNLVAGVSFNAGTHGAVLNVYRYDRATGNVELVSVSANGLSPGNADSGSPAI